MAEKEYIEREAVLNAIKGELEYLQPNPYPHQISTYELVAKGLNFACGIIKNQLTADVQEVRHGKWIKSKNERKCSLCGYFYFTNTKNFNFCPNCGAKMYKE